MINREVITANAASAGAVGACLAELEPVLTGLILITALAINIKTLLKRKKD